MKYLVIGRVGCGKTTMLNYISKKYDKIYTICRNYDGDLCDGDMYYKDLYKDINIKTIYIYPNIMDKLTTNGIILDSIFWDNRLLCENKVIKSIIWNYCNNCNSDVALVGINRIGDLPAVNIIDSFDYVYLFKEHIIYDIKKILVKFSSSFTAHLKNFVKMF